MITTTGLRREDVLRGFRIKNGKLIKLTVEGRERNHWIMAFRHKSRKFMKTQCEDCPSSEKLTIHHKTALSTAKNVEELEALVNDEKNCKTVCENCHMKLEEKKREIREAKRGEKK